MRRRLNIRLLAITGAVVVATAGAVHALHTAQVRRQATALLRQAEQAKAQGLHARSAQYFEAYLAYVPTDTAALAEYGLVLARAAKTARDRFRALEVLEQVLRRDGSRKEEREQAVRLAVELRQFGDAARHLEALRAAAIHPGELSEALGWAWFGASDYGRAVEAFADAVRQAPRRLDLPVKLADLYARRLDQPDRAGQVLEEMVTANPDSAGALLARARWREGRGQIDGAAADLDRAAALAPLDPTVHLAASEFARRRDRSDEARTHLERGFAVRPNDPRLHEAAANLELRLGQRKQARDQLRRGVAANPDDAALLLQLAECLLDEGSVAEAAALRARIAQFPGPVSGLDYLDARLLMRKGDWVEAARRLEKQVRDSATSSPWQDRAELALARCYHESGDAARRAQACARAVALDPGSVPARAALATALREAGRYEEAVEEGRQLTRRLQAPAEAWLELGRALVEWNRRKPAEQRDWTEVEAVCQEAGRVDDPTARVLLVADIRAAQGRYEEARTLLEDACRTHPKSAELWAARVDLATEAGRRDDAGQLLDAARRQIGDRPELHLADLRWLARQVEGGSIDPSRVRQELAARVRGLDKLSAAEHGRVLQAAAVVGWRLGESAAALPLAQQAVERRPQDLACWLTLFDIASTANDEAAARQALDGLRRVEGEEGVRWRCADAWLLMRHARRGSTDALEQARGRLDEAGRLQPGWGRVDLLKARLADQEGRSDRADSFYLQAFDHGERDLQVVAPLIQRLQDHGRSAEADRVLRQLAREMPRPGALARPAAELALRLRDYHRAVELAQQAVPPEARDYRDHLWLAQILETAARPAEAEEVFRRAVKQFADTPGPWVALVQFLARSGRAADAAAATRDAERHLAGAGAALALARCAEALGRIAEARTRYEAALAAAPDNPVLLQALAQFYLRQDQHRQAVPLLRALLSDPVEIPSAMADWARRELAFAFAAPATGEAVGRGLDLLAASPDPESLANRRARLLVLGLDPARRRDALRRFDETLAAGPLTPDEQFRLALLCEADKDRTRSRELMFSLLAAHGRDPRYLAAQVQVLLAHDELDEAQRWLRQLERIEPDSARGRELRASLAGKAQQAP
jgi:tetratricopeptide (TPR) repeat protein